jgi:predicted AAA+ superfamily ATPase
MFSRMIERTSYLRRLRAALKRNPVVALLGPRQCGKTTLAREFLPAGSPNYFDLEDPVVAGLLEHPMTALQPLRGLVVIDEAQRQPGVFPVLRVLADRADAPATFLLLGSASPDLSRQAAESLAGRVEIIAMRGFAGTEVPATELATLWLRGGFPRSFLAESDAASLQWRRDFVRTFLDRDLAGLGFALSPVALGRFWAMISHYHGQIWNGSEVAASLGIAPNTARNHLDALEQTYMIRRLPPWHANLGKRLVKSPKIYFRDSGLFHVLQGVGTAADLHRHPKLGASWEGFALEETLQAVQPEEACFYAVHSGAELDLFMIARGRRVGVEFKREDAPRLTHSMQTAMKDLKLDRLSVIYPGERRYRLHEKAEVLPLKDVTDGKRMTGG